MAFISTSSMNLLVLDFPSLSSASAPPLAQHSCAVTSAGSRIGCASVVLYWVPLRPRHLVLVLPDSDVRSLCSALVLSAALSHIITGTESCRDSCPCRSRLLLRTVHSCTKLFGSPLSLSELCLSTTSPTSSHQPAWVSSIVPIRAS
eukprot:1105142-Rhodomonas_salina.1